MPGNDNHSSLNDTQLHAIKHMVECILSPALVKDYDCVNNPERSRDDNEASHKVLDTDLIDLFDALQGRYNANMKNGILEIACLYHSPLLILKDSSSLKGRGMYVADCFGGEQNPSIYDVRFAILYCIHCWVQDRKGFVVATDESASLDNPDLISEWNTKHMPSLSRELALSNKTDRFVYLILPDLHTTKRE